jgi:hypothetical protein
MLVLAFKQATIREDYQEVASTVIASSVLMTNCILQEVWGRRTKHIRLVGRIQFPPLPPIFLGAFAKLRKAIISFVRSVILSVHMEKLGSHWTDFREIWYLRIFRRPVEKIQFSLKSNKNKGYFTWNIFIISRVFLPRMRNVSDKTCRENQNTHFLFSNFFWTSCRLWDNVEKYCKVGQATYAHCMLDT